MAADPQRDIDLHQKVSYLPDVHRLLPQASDAERGVLSSFLLAPREIGRLCADGNITIAHFHHPAHSVVYDTLLEFWRENEPIDFISITQWMRNKGTLDQIGGAPFITDLFTFLPTAANAAYYIAILEEKFILREIIKLGTEFAARSYDEQDAVPELLDGMEVGLMRLLQLKRGNTAHTRSLKELVVRAMERIDGHISGAPRIQMTTGIKALDKACLGFKPATVTMLVGSPSDGKSSLAMNIAEHLVFECGLKVGIISLDDTDDEVTDRLIQQMAKVSMFDIEQTRRLSDPDRLRIEAAAKKLGDAGNSLFIRDDGALTSSQISATFASWKSQHGLDFGIIDHIQLAKGDGFTRGSTEEASQVSRTLKPMAKRFNMPLLVLSQITASQDGSYKTKNTTSLQEDANRIWRIKNEEGTTDAWINIGKQKNGPKSSVPVKFEREFTRFSDRDHPPEEEQPNLIVQMPPPKKGKRK